MGISNSSKELTYYVIDDISSMNSFSKEHLDELGMQEHIKTEIQIKTYKLSEVLDKYLPSGQIIDFLNIDVEGFDQEVLFSNNWEKYRPRVLVVELSGKTLQDILENSITKYLSKLDYDVYGKTVILNCISSVVFIDRSFDF
jgi:hypothetical protein